MCNNNIQNSEPILEENPLRYVLFPIKYPKTWELCKKAQHSTWFADEIDFGDDKEHYNKLSNNEKHFINNVLAFFAASDGIVNENLMKNMMGQVQIPEVLAFYAHQMFIESIHCVSTNTKILTNNGYHEIGKLQNKDIEVWNGKEFSKTTVKFTGVQELYKVKLSNGMELDSTSEHKWFIRTGNRKHPETCKREIIFTKDLKENDIIHKYELPIIDCKDPDSFMNPYTHGFFCGDGSYCNGYPTISLYGAKKKLLKHFKVDKYSNEDSKIKFYITTKINKDKFVVPINYSKQTKLRWLEGLCDSDGCVSYNTAKTKTAIQIVSIDRNFLQDVQTMLTTLGCCTNLKYAQDARQAFLPDGKGGHKLYECKPTWVIYLTTWHISQLVEMGFAPKRLKLLVCDDEYTCNDRLITITSVEKLEGEHDTFCFTEPNEHAGIFNGILTGQSESYSLMIDTLVDPDTKPKLFEALQTNPIIKKMSEWAIKWMDSDKPFAQKMIAFACVEGIMFSGPFCAIYWLKKQGKMPGLCYANELISRDEGAHCSFASHIYLDLIVNKESYSTVLEIIKEAVELEIEFIIDSLPCSLIGMNSNMMTEYIQFIADRLLVDLGYSKYWKAKNPFPWMELISLDNKTNFFEKRVSEYSLASQAKAKQKDNNKNNNNNKNDTKKDKYGCLDQDEDF